MLTNLEGKASDPDNDPLRYEWSVVSSPQGSRILLFDAKRLNTRVWLDRDGIYVLKLTVSENFSSGVEYWDSDLMSITVRAY